MKKPLIFILGFTTALILGVSYKTYFQNKMIVLENPFSTSHETAILEEVEDNLATSTATSTPSVDVQ